MHRNFRVHALSFLSFACTGCGESALEQASLCEARIERAVLVVWDRNPQEAENPAAQKKAMHDLGLVLDTCPVPSEGISLPGAVTVSPIEISLLAGRRDDVRLKLESILFSDDAERASLLLLSAQFGTVDLVTAVVNAGVDAKLEDESGNNSISAAVTSIYDVEEKIAYLVSLGVDPLKKNHVGFSPLDTAVLASEKIAALKIISLLDHDDPASVESVRSAISIAEETNSPLRQELQDWLRTK